MGLGISPFLCDYYLLYWELKWCESVFRDIRDLQPCACTTIPTLLACTLYLDDIIHIFPLDRPGPEALKQSNGGPYPDSISIESEQRKRRVHFLEVSLSWRRPRYNRALSEDEPVVLTWSLHEKRSDSKFSKLWMCRGIHYSTALTLQHQSHSILSEGTRITWKCSRLNKFLSCFAAFAIDFVKQ